jgi:hypothetical protein
MTLYVLFLVAMLLQVTVGRTQALAMRSYIPDRSGLVAALIGIAAGVSFFAVIVWGFAWMPWYFVLPTIIFTGAISGFIVGRNSFAFWYQVRSLVDLAAAALTIFLWWKYWPL